MAKSCTSPVVGQVGWLNALNNFVVLGRIDIETARALIIEAHSNTVEEIRQQVDLYPTASAAAAGMGISRSTLYRRLAKAAGGGT